MKDLKYTSITDEMDRKRDKTEIKIGDIIVGKDFCVIAGPCSVEAQEQILKAALAVKKAGANKRRCI